MWTEELFGVKKPIIALLHLRALPGDPLYSHQGGMEEVIRIAREELHALQNGGVEGILFANEFSLPYEHKTTHVTTSAMARIIGALSDDIKVPFGVNVVLNPLASIELAVATDAQFVRSTFTGAYIGESGITDTDVAGVTRRRSALRADHIKMLYKVNPESDAYIAPRDLQKITKSIIFHCFPDGLCVSGDSAGSETDGTLIDVVKEVSGDVPVLCNTGCNRNNVAEKLAQSDGACVGTAFKVDGKFSNQVDEARVLDFMNQVRLYRATL